MAHSRPSTVFPTGSPNPKETTQAALTLTHLVEVSQLDSSSQHIVIESSTPTKGSFALLLWKQTPEIDKHQIGDNKFD